MKELTCIEAREYLLVPAGQLQAHLRSEVLLQHLRHCPECPTAIAPEKWVQALVRTAGLEDRASHSLRRRIVQQRSLFGRGEQQL